MEVMLKRYILPSQSIMASTPMRELAAQYGHERVMVITHSEAFSHMIARLYGFHNIVTVAEYVSRHQVLYPHKIHHTPPEKVVHLEDEEPIKAVLLLESPGKRSLSFSSFASLSLSLSSPSPPFSLIHPSPLLFADDWPQALQICLDVVRSDGIPGVKHEAATQVVKVFSGNPDLDYGAVHSLPRLTLGAFRVCLEALFRETTGRELEVELFGKPYPLIVKMIHLFLLLVP